LRKYPPTRCSFYLDIERLALRGDNMAIIFIPRSKIQAQIVPAGRGRKAEDQAVGHVLEVRRRRRVRDEEGAAVATGLVEQPGVVRRERFVQQGAQAQLAADGARGAEHHVLQARLEALHVRRQLRRRAKWKREVARHLVYQSRKQSAR